jgi:hypothetical protein
MPLAIARFVELLRLTLSRSRRPRGMVDASRRPPRRASSTCALRGSTRLLGTSLSSEQIVGLIEGLGFVATGTDH